MKHHLVFFFLLFSYSACFSQKSRPSYDSAFFNISIKGAQENISFKAIYYSLGKTAHRKVLEELEKRRLIKWTNYRTSLEIMPLGAGVKLYMPYKNIDNKVISQLLNADMKDKTILINARVIKGFEKVNGKPFFLIEKIRFLE